MEERANILIVDDNTSLSRTMSFVLKRHGYDVTIASDGHEAIEKVREKPFAMIFMDIKMPRLSGVDALRSIREIRPEAIVTMMTAYAVGDLVEDVLQQGAHGVLYKPVEMGKVIHIVETSLRSGRGESSGWSHEVPGVLVPMLKGS